MYSKAAPQFDDIKEGNEAKETKTHGIPKKGPQRTKTGKTETIKCSGFGDFLNAMASIKGGDIDD